MSYSIYVDGAAPNNQYGCTRGGIGLVVMDEDNEIVHEESVTINRKTDNAELELLSGETDIAQSIGFLANRSMTTARYIQRSPVQTYVTSPTQTWLGAVTANCRDRWFGISTCSCDAFRYRWFGA